METNSNGKTEYAFEFRGNTREYFGIWVINLVLTIVTLGVYSAWAKVRTNRYFYGNTLVAGSAFDYTADPRRILAGRAIAVVMLIIYQICIQFYPSFAVLVLIAFALALPFIYVASIAFRMRYSQWRGINFGFERDVRGAYLLFSPFMISLIILTVGPFLFGLSAEDFTPAEDATELSPEVANYLIFNLVVVFGAIALFPLWQRFYYNFIANHIRLGKSQFQISLKIGNFYSMYFAVFGIMILGIIAATVVVGVLGALVLSEDASMFSFLIPLYLAILVPYLMAYAFLQARLTNIVYSGIKLEDTEFTSTLKFGRMFSLYTTNTLAIIISLGLAIPWAKVRMANYRAENMFLAGDNLEAIAGQASDEIDASADAMSDIFDLDIGL